LQRVTLVDSQSAIHHNHYLSSRTSGIVDVGHFIVNSSFAQITNGYNREP